MSVIDEVAKEIDLIQGLTKSFIKEAVEKKSKEFLERMIRQQILDAASAASGGTSQALVALANNFEPQYRNEDVVIEIPTAKVEMVVNTVASVSVPQITMKLQTVAKITVPEVVMVKRRVGWHHHVKALKKWVKIGFVKTKVPNGFKHWKTPAYAHVPETRERIEEIKTHVPVTTFVEHSLKTSLPSVTIEMVAETFSVPVPIGLSVDLEGFALDVIPASNVLKEVVRQLKESQEFIEEYTEKAEILLNDVIGKVTIKVLDEINKLEDSVKDILVQIEAAQTQMLAKGVSEDEINEFLNNRNSDVDRILESIKPYREALEDIEAARQKALDIIEDIQIPSL
jgi:hypothetical protein